MKEANDLIGDKLKETEVKKVKDILDKLYDLSVAIREAFRDANQGFIYYYLSVFQNTIIDLYKFNEKYKFKYDSFSNKINSMIESYNNFVNYYNKFIESKDRLSTSAQKMAKKAEEHFYNFVNLNLNLIDLVDKTIDQYNNTDILSQNTKDISTYNDINNNNEINISVNVNLDLQITNLIENAKNEVSKLELDKNELDDIIAKIIYLEKTINSKKDKASRWGNIKKTVKWMASQSFEIAKIIIPIIFEAIK